MNSILGQIAHKFVEGSVGVIVDENLKSIEERERYQHIANRKTPGRFQTEFEKEREQNIQNHNIRINNEINFCEKNNIAISSRVESKYLFQILASNHIQTIHSSAKIVSKQSISADFAEIIKKVLVVIFVIIMLVIIFTLFPLIIKLMLH